MSKRRDQRTGPFRLKQRVSVVRHRVTKDEMAALENAARETIRFGGQLLALAEQVQSGPVLTELRVLLWLAERASVLVERKEAEPRPEPRPEPTPPDPLARKQKRAALAASLDLGSSMPRATTRKGQTAA